MEAFNANDIDALGAFFADDIEIYPIEGWPDEQVYRGREAAKKIFAVWWEFFDSTHIEIERTIEKDDLLVSLLVQTGVHQGVTVEQHVGSVARFRDGLVERIDYFLSWEKALEVAGIAEG